MINPTLDTVTQRLKWLWPGWSRHERKQFAVGSVLAFVIVPTVAWFAGLNIGNAILWATGIVLLVYTIETQAMRLEMVRQNEIAIEPVVIAIIEERSAAKVPAPTFCQQLILQNIGRGPALFLRVQDLTLTDPAGDRVRFVARFTPVSYLEPQHETVVRVAECQAIDVLIPSAHLNPLQSLEQSTALEDYDVVIRYQDTNGGARETVMRMGKAGVSLVRHGKAGGSRRSPRPHNSPKATMK